MPKFRTKPMEIEAWQYRPGEPMPKWAQDYCAIEARGSGPLLMCQTLNGAVRAEHQDWLIRGQNEVYPCNPVVFDAKYEAI